MRLLPVLALLGSACQAGSIALGDDVADDPEDTGSDTVVDTDDAVETDDTEDTEEPGPDTSMYDGADLVVTLPVSGAIYPLSTGFPYDAKVMGADGSPLAFDAITWTIPGGSKSGRRGEWPVEAGVYNVGVEALLPNGDRLKSSIGAVRVQSALTGVWSGTVGIATFTEVQDQTLRTDCVGTLDFDVDLAGETITGSGGCTLAIPLVGTVNLTYDVEGDIVGNTIENGSLLIDVPFLQVPVAFDGGFTSPNAMQGAFEADLTVLRMEGTIAARKITPYTRP